MKLALSIFLFFQSSILNVLDAHDYKYQLAIGAIFRDEAPYLKEWLEFHKLVGVEHFYLFNHFSQDDYAQVLQPYIDCGEVELFQWEEVANTWEDWLYIVQANAYSKCIEVANEKVKWLAIIDLDEFLTPISSDNVIDILNDFEEFGGVGFNWKLFGHSGYYDLPPNKLMIECLLMTAKHDRSTHLGVKSIVRPERVSGCHHPHYMTYRDGFYHVNSNKEPSIDSQGITTGIFYDRLVINHYWSRTGRHLYKKMQRWNLFVPNIIPENWPDYVKDMNVMRDHTMERFIPSLREKMGLINYP